MDELTPEEFLETVLRTRIKAAVDFPELDLLLRSEIPKTLFAGQMETTFDRFSQGMKFFAACHPDLIRVQHLETAIELGSIVVESSIRSIASSHPERLQDEVLIREFVDLMLRYILKR